jgi:membrane-associated phospholipid phosphatase
VRRKRAVAFEVYVFVASAVFLTMAVLARTVGYFPIDLTVTRAIQRIDDPGFADLMRFISWFGFIPQVDLIAISFILLLFTRGLRWEAVSAIFAALGPILGPVIKWIVARPRPTADLVEVFSTITSPGFPSGHVLMVTTFYGFMTFLGYTLFKSSWVRTLLLLGFAVLISLMGVSRIYLGHHWFSDVIGAYLFGSLWLALAIHVYRWGKPRFFAHQPAAPEKPARST